MSRMCLSWDYFFRLPFFAIDGVACVELSHSSLADWKDIFIIHLIIIIKSEVSTFPIVVIFFRGCVSGVWDGCTTIFCHLLHIYLGNTGTLFPLFVFSLLMFSLWYLQTIGCIIACRSCSFVLQITPSHYHHNTDIWRHWTNKILVRYICCRVCVYDWDYSRNYLSFNIWGCVSSAYPIRLSWLWECVLYFIVMIKPEVWIINHCLGLGHETMVCAVCLIMFLGLDFLHTGQWCRFCMYCIGILNKSSKSQRGCPWFEPPWRSCDFACYVNETPAWS